MNLYALSDLHLANTVNQNALLELPDYRDNWLALAGDIGEKEDHLKFALSVLKKKFSTIIWTPGNHDLWTFPLNSRGLKGEAKYNRLVSICHDFDVVTPEDEYPIFQSNGQDYCLSPTLTLYDYSFKPDNVKPGKEVEWAAESGVICADEELLFSHPHKSISDWCYKRCLYTERRLASVPNDLPLIIINHYPLIKELGKIYSFPRFSIWCGTQLTEKWFDLFNIKIVVYGHLHLRSSKNIIGVRHEEVSLGYPLDWDQSKGMCHYLRKII